MANGNDAWHRGSRFWRLGGHALYMTGALLAGIIVWRPGEITAGIGMYTALCGLLFGGGTVVNAMERQVHKAQVEAGQDPGGGP